MSKSITDIVITQGPSSMLNDDTNNCTVLALSATLGVSYDVAYKMAEDNWKRPLRKGARLSSLINYFKDNNTPEVDTVNVYHTKWNNKDVKCKMNLSTFSKRYSEGNYYVVVGHHALAVIDGNIVDHKSNIARTRRVVKHAWKIK